MSGREGRKAMHNILVCDDDRDIVAALKIYLSGGEYRVFEAYNGAEAVEAVRKNDIHLVLMDIMMPELDGIAATAAIRRESNAPIILLTAKSESSDKVLGLNVGADDYITKPFDPVEVLARVKSQLRRYTLLGAKPETAPEPAVNVIPISTESKQPGESKADEEPIAHNSQRDSMYSTKVVLGGDRLRKYFPDVSMTPDEIVDSIYSALEERRQREARMKQKTEILHPGKPAPTR